MVSSMLKESVFFVLRSWSSQTNLRSVSDVFSGTLKGYSTVSRLRDNFFGGVLAKIINHL